MSTQLLLLLVCASVGVMLVFTFFIECLYKPYIDLPLYFKRHDRFNPQQEIRRIDQSQFNTLMPAEAQDFLLKTGERIEELGFTIRAWVFFPDMNHKLNIFVGYLYHPENRDFARIYVFSLKTAPHQCTCKMILFGSRFSNEQSLIVNNCPFPNIWSPFDDVTAFRFPEEQTAARLYAIFCELSKRQDPSLSKLNALDDRFQGDVVNLIRENLAINFEDAAKNQYLIFDPDDGMYHHTYKGAFRVVWMNLFPWKQIRHAALRRQNQQVLAELNLN